MSKLLYLLCLFPVVVYAQSPQGMPPHMQMNMEQMQKAAACMENLDFSIMDKLEEEEKKVGAEIQSLCQSGKRREAQDRAITMSEEMMNRPELQQFRECSKMMAGMMPQMPFQKMEDMGNDRHICDDY